MVHLFAVQTTNKEEYEIIDKLKKLHEEFRNEAIVLFGYGHTKGGAWNTAKTIKRILSESKYAYILTEEKEICLKCSLPVNKNRDCKTKGCKYEVV